jgi:hypothetical protein
VGVGTCTPIFAAVECFSLEEDGDSSSGAGEEPQPFDCDAVDWEFGVSPPVVGEDLEVGTEGSAPEFGKVSMAVGQDLCGDFVDLSTAGGDDINDDEGLSSQVPELGFLPLDTVGKALAFVELSTTEGPGLNWRPKPNFERRCAVEWQGECSPVYELPYLKERGEYAAQGGRCWRKPNGKTASVDLSTSDGEDINGDEDLSSQGPELGFLPWNTVGKALEFVELSTTAGQGLDWHPKPNFGRSSAVEWQGECSPVYEVPYLKECGEDAAHGGSSLKKPKRKTASEASAFIRGLREEVRDHFAAAQGLAKHTNPGKRHVGEGRRTSDMRKRIASNRSEATP